MLAGETAVPEGHLVRMRCAIVRACARDKDTGTKGRERERDGHCQSTCAGPAGLGRQSKHFGSPLSPEGGPSHHGKIALEPSPRNFPCFLCILKCWLHDARDADRPGRERRARRDVAARQTKRVEGSYSQGVDTRHERLIPCSAHCYTLPHALLKDMKQLGRPWRVAAL